MKIGILGGSFSPPHKGHLHAALSAREQLSLDEIFLIPAGEPPHKELPQGTPSKAQRLEMTRLAAESIGAEVSDIELAREGKSYTADTLMLLREKYPEDELYFIMGTDMFLTLDSWYKPEVIFSLARIAPIAREVSDEEKIQKKALSLGKKGAQVEIIREDAYPISSTEIREDIYRMRDFLPEGVWEYILRENLYGIAGNDTGGTGLQA